jgi:hypothetical protein
MSGIRSPWRHLPKLYGLTDGGSERARVFVRQQRHGRGFAGTVAGLAVVLEDWQDVVVERRGGLRGIETQNKSEEG